MVKNFLHGDERVIGRFTIPPLDEEQSNAMRDELAKRFGGVMVGGSKPTTLTPSEVEAAIKFAEMMKRNGKEQTQADVKRLVPDNNRIVREKARQEIANWLRDTALCYYNKPGHVLEGRAVMIAADMLQRAINSRE